MKLVFHVDSEREREREGEGGERDGTVERCGEEEEEEKEEEVYLSKLLFIFLQQHRMILSDMSVVQRLSVCERKREDLTLIEDDAWIWMYSKVTLIALYYL